jgi:hypothetical protein
VSPAKKPADHKRKGAADQLRDEAANIPGIAETQDKSLVIVGRLGEVTVTTLNMLDWDAEVPSALREGDYLTAICGMISPEDAARLRASKPTLGAMMTAVYAPDPATGEASPGESQAS